MKADNEGLQALSRGVLGRVKTEAGQVLADAKDKADRIHLKAEEQAEEVRREILEQVTREVAEVRQQVAVRTRLEAQAMRLKYREKLLDDVFSAVQEKLPSVRQWGCYNQIVQQLVSEAVRSLSSDSARIRADGITRASLTADVLRELEGDLGVHLDLGPELEHGTGVVAETPDGHRRFDNTLETRLVRRRDTFRAPVYHLLTGGKKT